MEPLSRGQGLTDTAFPKLGSLRGHMHGHCLVTPLLLSYLIFTFQSDEFPAFLNKSVHSGATYFNCIPHLNGITRV